MSNVPRELLDAWRAVDDTPSIVIGLRRAEELGRAAATCGDPNGAARMLGDVTGNADDLGAIAALHAIGRVASTVADEVLVRTLLQGSPATVGHAAWVLGGRIPQVNAIGALLDLVVSGGFDAMLAQRTLVQWSVWAGDLIADRILGRLTAVGPDLDVDAGTRLVDVLRAADAARLPVATPSADARAGDAVTVVQPFLHARLDATGSQLGRGDAGGIASLLRSLGTELARQPGVAEVLTVTRANPLPGVAGHERRHELLASGHRLARIPYGSRDEISLTEAWVHRIPIERELTALARSLQGPVVWHVRMGDVGTLAASAAARTLGHKVVFTVAPDPHAVIEARQHDGRLDRGDFGAVDAAEHLWFRARLVERLAVFADQLVALPRPHLARDLGELVGLDVAVDLERRQAGPPDHREGARGRERIRVIAEGVDTRMFRRAEQRADALGHEVPAPVAQLLDILPDDRRDRPWLVTVGRLNPLKGPHRLAEAWAGSPDLAERFNLVIIGGDLADPSASEAATIDLIREAADTTGTPTPGLVLAGHSPPDDVADLLVHAARHNGVYVAASDKEEFGLAAVEALGAGLVVVAPERGGAGSYIESGVNGVLVDTTSVPALTHGIRWAATRADDHTRWSAARRQVDEHLSVTTMAERLSALYCDLVDADTLAPTGS